MVLFIVCTIVGLISPFVIKHGMKESQPKIIIVGIVLLLTSSILPFISWGGDEQKSLLSSVTNSIPGLPTTGKPEDEKKFIKELIDNVKLSDPQDMKDSGK